jgi:hypothetical protein
MACEITCYMEKPRRTESSEVIDTEVDSIDCTFARLSKVHPDRISTDKRDFSSQFLTGNFGVSNPSDLQHHPNK